jgi:hypothetical protein
MSYARTLARKIDSDLIERIEASGKPEVRQTMVRRSAPRPAGSYRGARRNEAQALRQGGPRKPMLTFIELLKINAMHARNQSNRG